MDSFNCIGGYWETHKFPRVETRVIDSNGVPIFTGDVVASGSTIGPSGDTEYTYDVVTPVYYNAHGKERVLYEPASYYKDGSLEVVGSIFSSTPEELNKWGIFISEEVRNNYLH